MAGDSTSDARTPHLVHRAVSRRFPEPIQVALELLLRAYRYARDAGAETWEFAVEIDELRAVGVTGSEFRWLVFRGYVEHRREVTLPTCERRAFHALPPHGFPDGTCFTLTALGAAVAEGGTGVPSDVGASASSGNATNQDLDVHGRASGVGPRRFAAAMPAPAADGRAEGYSDGGPPISLKPHWDAERHELWLGDDLVKRFKWPAPNQETILAAFEEESWPPAVDDPLPPQPEQDPKRRLHDTIKCLNRGQAHRLLHFRGDGTGERVVWESVLSRARDATRRVRPA